LTDPSEIAESQLVISRILLAFISSGIDNGQVDGIDRRLAQYQNSIQAARNVLVNSEVDPRKRVAAYKRLEATARDCSQTLVQIRSRVSIDLASSVDAALARTDAIRSEVRSRL
jgi:hypothetical protein